MLFDPRPKSRREELFGRDVELNLLHDNVNSPIIVIAGIRRIGKTSLLNVFLNEVNIPNIIVDLRDLHSNYGLKDLFEILSKALSSRLDKLMELLKSITSIKILGGEIEIKWKGRGALTLPTLFDSLNRSRVIIAFDEAQMLRGPRSMEILNAIAHAYDYDKNLTFIFTGSEVGLLHDSLGIEKPESPLYGRYCFKLNLERFKRDVAEEFLLAGFREMNVKVDKGLIEEAVNSFDGIPGWLTLFGNEYVRGLKNLDKIKEVAVNMALSELKNLVAGRSKRYATVLRGLAEGMNSWGKIKGYVEEHEGSTISSSILSNILRSLEDLSIIKDYEFLDPIYKEASLRL
ncbi:MAG: ATP-binding protein [archaeon YNP-LCB-003-016]|uniref:AAA family ATPase n=1 Tax=Candidatus Culexarchaeum yellowstonense TaxID=2928963 RepID=UPI0026EBC7BB|nr:ATP-binding protein [Candidatus Culexarchaeum yellowstonense]MCR6692313.1 ATP-binding protein [Candidatus Culexarchaeum yellowstonense]